MFNGAKPEEFVFDDRSADRAAELLAIEGRLDYVTPLEQIWVGVGKQLRGVRVESVVAEEPEYRPPQPICSTLRDYREQCAPGAAVGSRESLGRKRKLLYSFHCVVLEDASHRIVFVVAAINGYVEIAASSASD